MLRFVLLALLLPALLIPALPAHAKGGNKGARDKGEAKPAKDERDKDKTDPKEAGQPDVDKDVVIVDSPLEHLEAPCAQGDGAACYEAGLLWYRGEVQGEEKPNLLRAVNLFQAACAFPVVDGCMMAARMYLQVEAGMQLIAPDMIVSADLGSAASNLKFACNAGRRDACGMMGDLYVNPESRAPEGGTYRGIEQDYFYAAQAYQDGCNAAATPDPRDVRPDGSVDARSCARLGELHEGGLGVMLSAETALDYYERACRAGLAPICDKEQALRQALADGTYASPGQKARAERAQGERGPGQVASLKPDTERFKDDATGIADRKKEDGIRLDLVGMLGSRWYYGPPQTRAGIKFKAGFTLWVKLIGFGFETGFNTDRLFLVDERGFARYAHSLLVKGTFPVPIRLPIPAVVGLGIGAGPTIGHQRTKDVPFFWVYGAREYVQVWISTAQRRGPRQWGAFRFEQQQTWLTHDARLEHSSQILFLFGFTFGGVAPEYPKGGGRPKDEMTGRDSPRPGGL